MNDDSEQSDLSPPANPLPPAAEPLPVAPVLGYASSEVNYKPRPPIPGVVRFAGFTAGVALPIICFLFAIAGYPDGPDWQSGRFEDYVKLFLSARSAWPFFPLLIYSMICMLRICINPRRNGPRPFCRVGIYGGVILAAQFCVIMVISLAGASDEGVIRVVGAGAIAILIPAGLLALLNFSFRRFGAARVWQMIAYIAVVTLLAGLLISARGVLGAVFGGAFASLIIAPGWTLATFITVAVLIRRLPPDSSDSTRASLKFLLPAWLTAYAASWALAVQQAIRAYHDLPTTPPHRCYIASAAAKGHPRFVRARHTCAGACINVQLQRLKCGEIALATLTPRLHHLIRDIYDRIGPSMASAMIHPLLADCAYALLKPAEWMTLLLLRPTVKQFDQLAAGIYLNDKPASAAAKFRAAHNCQ
jgi:hypothetical protein